MDNIFDLANLSRLVADKHPVCIMVADTNVLMNEPDLTKWGMPVGQTLFVLSDFIAIEIEDQLGIRKRHRKKKAPGAAGKADSDAAEALEAGDKAYRAMKSLVEIRKRGAVTKGVGIDSGWVIAVPAPNRNELDSELNKLKDMTRCFKERDVQLLLLTRECGQLFKSIPVIMLTGDENLSNIVEMNGVPCHLHTGFPIQELGTTVGKWKECTLNWDDVLSGVQKDIRNNPDKGEPTLQVEATLLSYKSPPAWLCTKGRQPVIAEGRGVMHDGQNNRNFLWTMSFYPWTLDDDSAPPKDESSTLPSIYLDFMGDEDFSQDVFDAVADRLYECRDPIVSEGAFSLQNPESIMEMLLLLEYWNSEGVSDDAARKLKQEIADSDGITNYWADWVLSRQDEDEESACLYVLIDALRSCWRIGQTYSFGISRSPEGRSKEDD